MTKCPKCGEESEDQFDSCWKCGTALRTLVTSVTVEDQISEAERLPEVRSDGHFWLLSILVPLGLLGLGILVALAQPQNQNDWIGVGAMIPVMVGSVLAAISALGFSAVSIFRAERHAAVAFLSGAVAVIYLAFVIISVAKAIR